MARLPEPNTCARCALPFAEVGTEHHPDGYTMLLKPRERPMSSRSRLVCGPCAETAAAAAGAGTRSAAVASAKKARRARFAEAAAVVPTPVNVMIPRPVAPKGPIDANDAAAAGKQEATAVAPPECPGSPFYPEKPPTRIQLYYMGMLDEPLHDCERENKCGPGVCNHNPEDLQYGINHF